MKGVIEAALFLVRSKAYTEPKLMDISITTERSRCLILFSSSAWGCLVDSWPRTHIY